MKAEDKCLASISNLFNKEGTSVSSFSMVCTTQHHHLLLGKEDSVSLLCSFNLQSDRGTQKSPVSKVKRGGGVHTRERKPNLSPHKKGKVALLVLASGGWWGEEVELSAPASTAHHFCAPG